MELKKKTTDGIVKPFRKVQLKFLVKLSQTLRKRRQLWFELSSES